MKILQYDKIKLNNLDLNEIYKKIELNLLKKKKQNFTFLNPHSLVTATYDKEFYNALNKSTNFIDGIGLQLYFFFKNLFILNFCKINRNTGHKVFFMIINKFKNKKFFFLGSDKKCLLRIQTRLIKEFKFKKKNIKFYSPPFVNKFSKKTNSRIIRQMNLFKPDIIFIGMTAPKQEKWISYNQHKIKYKISFSIGAVFDYFSNKYDFLIKLFSRLGIEWLFRLIIQKRIWRRIVISFPLFLLISFRKKIFINKTYQLKVISKINNFILNEEKFILSAFNLAFYAYCFKKIIKLNKYFYTWPDGITYKFFNNKINKLPGHELINGIQLPPFYKTIHIVGNLDINTQNYLSKRFKNKKIKFTKIPYINLNKIKKININISHNELILTTLPTPKQEIIATKIFKKNFSKKPKIICIGGGVFMASGTETKSPHFISKLGLEFLWRLRFETKRRVARLFTTLGIFIISFLELPIIKFNLEVFDED